jgi:transcriptional regulator with XRE-family HTH domain
LPFCQITLTARKYSCLHYDENLLTLGDHLKKRRYSLRQHQRHVAKLLGVSPETVYNWEHNRSAPSLHHIPKVIEFLGYDPYTIKEGLGESIIQARRALGMTQKELARRLGVDPGTLGKWERGERKPNRGMEEKIKKFFGFLNRTSDWSINNLLY